MGGARRALELGQQLLGVLAAVQEYRHAAAFLLDMAQALVHAPGMAATLHFQRIQHRQRFMHAHRHRLAGLPLPQHQSQVKRAAGLVAVGVGDELSMHGAQRPRGDLLDQRFGATAVLDQVGDGADLQAVLGGKLLQVGQARHGAVVLHDLADHGGRRAAGHGGQVATGFGMAGAHQHAAIDGLQRKDVTGLHQILRARAGRHGRLHGTRAVGRADAGGDAFGGLDGDREGGAHLGAVARHHGRQAQALAALARQRQADQAAAEARHEVDGFGRDVVGREDQVALVLAVFLVDQDDHAAGGEIGHDVGHRRDGRGSSGVWRQGSIHGGHVRYRQPMARRENPHYRRFAQAGTNPGRQGPHGRPC